MDVVPRLCCALGRVEIYCQEPFSALALVCTLHSHQLFHIAQLLAFFSLSFGGGPAILTLQQAGEKSADRFIIVIITTDFVG